MSAEELRRIVTLDRDTYVPRAQELADSELVSRGLLDCSDEAPPAGDPSGGVGLNMTWADVWAALLATTAVGNPATGEPGLCRTPACSS